MSFRSLDQTDPVDWNSLADYLARNGVAGRFAAPRQFAGGLGNWNYLLEIGKSRLVLRRPPDGPLPVGANDMARENRILSRLHRHFPLAPEVRLYCEDAGVIGAPFLLMEYREGFVVRSTIPATYGAICTGEILTSDAIDVLTALHALDPDVVGVRDLGRPEGMVERQARNWRMRAEAAFDARLPTRLQEVSQWLSRPAPLAQRVSILHSDFKFDNLILDPTNGKPVALIDWDMSTLGDPLLDVATFLSYWIEPDDPPEIHSLRQMPTASGDFPCRAEVLAVYAKRSGLDVSDFGYYRILALFKLCVVFQQLYQRYLQGLTQDGRAASFAPLIAGLVAFTASTLERLLRDFQGDFVV